MDKMSPDGEHAAKDVTIVIRRKIKPGCEKQFDDWLRRFLMLVRFIETGLQAYVTIVVVDRKSSLVVELKDDTKESWDWVRIQIGRKPYCLVFLAICKRD